MTVNRNLISMRPARQSLNLQVRKKILQKELESPQICGTIAAKQLLYHLIYQPVPPECRETAYYLGLRNGRRSAAIPQGDGSRFGG